MFVKQIDLNEALKLAAKGKEIKVLVSSAPEDKWSCLVPDTLQDMLEGCLFFRDELAMVESEFEAAVQEMDDQIPPPSPGALAASGTKKPAGKRRPVDTGKIMALHKAGWSNTKIADELGISDVTVGKYVKQMEVKEDAED